MRIIRRYAEANGLRTFVETGTFFGETANAMRGRVDKVLTIELDPWLFARAQRRFRRTRNVDVMFGDSGALLQVIAPALREPTLFWLDGHFSGGITARGAEDTPVLHELAAILSSSPDHVVLIDDARAFDGRGAYPSIHQLGAHVHTFRPDHVTYVSDDIIRVHSPDRANLS